MVNAFIEGRVTWKIYDYGSYYTPQFVYKRLDGQHTAVTMQFFRHTFGQDKDLPGNTKKDQIYLMLEGLDQVDFGNKNMLECLEDVQAGTMHVDSEEEAQVDWTPCASWDKDLGW